MKVKVVLAAALDDDAFIPLEAVGTGVEDGADAPHVQENADG